MGTTEEISVSTYSPTSKALFYLIEMLKTYTTASLLGKRIYPPPVVVSAQMPRVTVQALTPVERKVGIGEYVATAANRQIWRIFTFKIDAYDRDPKGCRNAADDITRAIWNHRRYPDPPTNTSGNYFYDLEVIGGTGIGPIDSARQLYECTLNVRGTWLELHG